MKTVQRWSLLTGVGPCRNFWPPQIWAGLVEGGGGGGGGGGGVACNGLESHPGRVSLVLVATRVKNQSCEPLDQNRLKVVLYL